MPYIGSRIVETVVTVISIEVPEIFPVGCGSRRARELKERDFSRYTRQHGTFTDLPLGYALPWIEDSRNRRHRPILSIEVPETYPVEVLEHANSKRKTSPGTHGNTTPLPLGHRRETRSWVHAWLAKSSFPRSA